MQPTNKAKTAATAIRTASAVVGSCILFAAHVGTIERLFGFGPLIAVRDRARGKARRNHRAIGGAGKYVERSRRRKFAEGATGAHKM
jgi:hypothetical protein